MASQPRARGGRGVGGVNLKTLETSAPRMWGSRFHALVLVPGAPVSPAYAGVEAWLSADGSLLWSQPRARGGRGGHVKTLSDLLGSAPRTRG